MIRARTARESCATYDKQVLPKAALENKHGRKTGSDRMGLKAALQGPNRGRYMSNGGGNWAAKPTKTSEGAASPHSTRT